MAVCEEEKPEAFFSPVFCLNLHRFVLHWTGKQDESCWTVTWLMEWHRPELMWKYIKQHFKANSISVIIPHQQKCSISICFLILHKRMTHVSVSAGVDKWKLSLNLLSYQKAHKHWCSAHLHTPPHFQPNWGQSLWWCPGEWLCLTF